MAKRRNRTVMPSKTEGKAPRQKRKAGCTHPLRPNSEFRVPNYLTVPPRAPTPVPELKPAGTNAAPANNLYTHNNTQPHCGRRNSADKRPR